MQSSGSARSHSMYIILLVCLFTSVHQKHIIILKVLFSTDAKILNKMLPN